jgi:hypothetical protein
MTASNTKQTVLGPGTVIQFTYDKNKFLVNEYESTHKIEAPDKQNLKTGQVMLYAYQTLYNAERQLRELEHKDYLKACDFIKSHGLLREFFED